jgi:hypothetical protein
MVAVVGGCGRVRADAGQRCRRLETTAVVVVNLVIARVEEGRAAAAWPPGRLRGLQPCTPGSARRSVSAQGCCSRRRSWTGGRPPAWWLQGGADQLRVIAGEATVDAGARRCRSTWPTSPGRGPAVPLGRRQDLKLEFTDRRQATTGCDQIKAEVGTRRKHQVPSSECGEPSLRHRDMPAPHRP